MTILLKTLTAAIILALPIMAATSAPASAATHKRPHAAAHRSVHKASTRHTPVRHKNKTHTAHVAQR